MTRVLLTTAAFFMCPGDDIALGAATLGLTNPDAHDSTPHEGIIPEKTEVKLPGIRIERRKDPLSKIRRPQL